MFSREQLYGSTAAEVLKRWDADQICWTIEMGGLGPGYEQCIQILTFEIIRDYLNDALPDDPPNDWWRSFGDPAVKRLDPYLGFSGAQVGCAKNLAFRGMKEGWADIIESVPQNRRIQVQRKFPVVPHG